MVWPEPEYDIPHSASFHMYNIRRIRKYLNNDATQMLVHSIVIGCLDYCNSLLYKVPVVHMSKLQRIQNGAAQLVCSTPRFNHITPVLFSLQWLPAVAYRIKLKILAVLYLQSSLIKGEKCKYQLRSSEKLLIAVAHGKNKENSGWQIVPNSCPRTVEQSVCKCQRHR